MPSTGTRLSMDNPEIRFRVRPDVYEQVKQYSGELSLALADYARVCLMFGLQYWRRSMHPEQEMTPEAWVGYFKASGVTVPQEMQDAFGRLMSEILREYEQGRLQLEGEKKETA